MATGNVFMNASQKAKVGMAKAAQASVRKASPQKEKVVNVRVSPELHRRMMEHRLNTGESMNAMLLRLIQAELEGDTPHEH